MAPGNDQFGQMTEREILIRLTGKVDGLCEDVGEIKNNGCRRGVRNSEHIASLQDQFKRRGGAVLPTLMCIMVAVSLIVSVIALLR